MLETTLNGLGAGAQYALLAMAIVVVFKTTTIVNFSVGALATAAVYLAIWFDNAGLPAVAALILAGLSAAILSVLTDILVVTPIAQRFPKTAKEAVLVVLIVLFVAADDLIGVIWGTTPKALPRNLEIPGTYHIAGAVVTEATVLTYVITVAMVIATAIVLQRTRVGLIVRAIAEKEPAVGLVGIHATKYKAVTWAYAGVLSAIAGLLLATSITPSPTMTQNVLIDAVAGVALGGISSIWGAVCGSLMIGLLESFTIVYLNPSLSNILPMATILIVLAVRPSGLFGSAEIVRV